VPARLRADADGSRRARRRSCRSGAARLSRARRAPAGPYRRACRRRLRHRRRRRPQRRRTLRSPRGHAAHARVQHQAVRHGRRRPSLGRARLPDLAGNPRAVGQRARGGAGRATGRREPPSRRAPRRALRGRRRRARPAARRRRPGHGQPRHAPPDGPLPGSDAARARVPRLGTRAAGRRPLGNARRADARHRRRGPLPCQDGHAVRAHECVDAVGLLHHPLRARHRVLDPHGDDASERTSRSGPPARSHRPTLGESGLVRGFGPLGGPAGWPCPRSGSGRRCKSGWINSSGCFFGRANGVRRIPLCQDAILASRSPSNPG
jgi:hypothetical protein